MVRVPKSVSLPESVKRVKGTDSKVETQPCLVMIILASMCFTTQ